MANQINTRIIHKHDTEVNWNKATSFIPKQGEIIVYDRDDNYTYERFKIGDGVTAAPSLPFATKNAFGNVKVGSTTIAADSFSDTLTLTAGANISLTPSTSGDSVTIVATDTTYSAGNGLTLSNTTFNVGAGTGISVAADTVGLATVDTVTAGTYGPSAAVTGSNNATMNVPEITVDEYGRVTSITNRVYTAKNSTYTSLKNPYALTIKGNGTTSFTYNGSAAKTLNIVPGTNITVTSDTSGNITIGNSYSYSLPNATGTTKGGVIVGSNITVSSGTISLTKANITAALGYTPPTTDTTYTAMTGATSSAAGTSGLVPAPAAGKQSSFLRGDGTWVVPTDNKVTQTVVDVNGDGYVVYSTSNSDTITGVNKNLAIRIRNNVGTTSTIGESAFILGNSIASGTAGNKQGRLYIYGSNTGYHILEAGSTTSNITHILPTVEGTLLNSGNYTSYTVKKDGTGASGTWGISISGIAAKATIWETSRTLTIGAKAQSVNGNANVSWSLYDILKVGSIGNDTSWEVTEPGVYHVSGSAFTGSGNPEAANGGLAPYRYGQLIVSKGGPTGGLAEFYISHADSKPNSPEYGIKFRSGWNGTYQTTWRTLVDNVNISNFAISTNGGTLTGGNLIIDRGTEEPKYAFYRTVSDVVHRGLLNLNSAGAVKLGYYDADWASLNYIILGSEATTLGQPLAIGSGGTGATSAASALTNLGIVISATQPTTGLREGLIWLKTAS